MDVDEFDRTRVIAAMVVLRAWADLEQGIGRCPECRGRADGSPCEKHRPEMEIAQATRNGILESWRPEYRACFAARTKVIDEARLVVARLVVDGVDGKSYLAWPAADLGRPLIERLVIAVHALSRAQVALNGVKP